MKQFVLTVLLLLTALPGGAEQTVVDLSQNSVSITASFDGSEIFIFGAVKRETRIPDDRGPLHVIISIEGPGRLILRSEDPRRLGRWSNDPVLVRRKERTLGIWVNADAVEVDEAPHFFALASTAPVEDILSYTDALRHRIGLNHVVKLIDAPGNVADVQDFREAVIRIRGNEGLFVELPGSVKLTDETLFNTEIELPANIVEGDYRARVFLLRDKAVIDAYETVIAVRKTGLERWVYTLAHEQPFIYGILSIAVALFAGWAAAEVFRRIRR
ncbi:MAG: TIGR02186 family protein [Pseudomonadota bacterium]